MEYLYYLVPQDNIQKVFCLVVFGLAFLNAVWVKIRAKPNRWEYKWNNGTPQTTDDMDASHGSVIELSDMVATSAERCAEILPNILLILGLFGTFLGLGISLSKAEGILGSAGVADFSSNPADKLNELLGMLDGMGAQFKSSIYGIIGFLLFSLWYGRFGTDGKRLAWCVKKCNEQIHSTRKNENTHRAVVLNELRNLSSSIGESLGSSLYGVLDKYLKEMNETAVKQNKVLISGFERQQDDLKKLITYSEKLTKSMSAMVKNFSEEMEKMGKSFEEELSKMSSDLKNEVTRIGVASNKMGDAARTLADSSDSLRSSVEQFTPAVTSTLNSIEKNFIASINESSGKMTEAGGKIKTAVQEMSAENKKGQDALKATLDNFQKEMKVSLGAIQESADAMNGMAAQTEQGMKNFVVEVKNQMTSISGANTSIRSELKKLTDAIDIKEQMKELISAVQSIEVSSPAISTSTHQEQASSLTLSGNPIVDVGKKSSMLGLLNKSSASGSVAPAAAKSAKPRR
ncbi:MAG: hypothetical protein HUK20_04080 [Fibrobacter sp.]|nr:hypothetical protein [Fibrobacter sp.]